MSHIYHTRLTNTTHEQANVVTNQWHTHQVITQTASDTGNSRSMLRSTTNGLQTPEHTVDVMEEYQNMDSSSSANNNNENGNNNNEPETYADADGEDPSQMADESALDESQTSAGEAAMRDNNNDSMDATRKTPKSVPFEVKPDGKSAKYPELKRYYEFGGWVGRNRRAICIRCRHTAASSQPLRLIKHLRKCPELTEVEKAEVEDLLVYSDNKDKWKPNKPSGSGYTGDESDIWGSDSPNKSSAGTSGGAAGSSFLLPAPPVKRVKRDHPEWKASVDQALVRWIVHNRVPLKTIHSKEFVEFVRALDPEYHLPSRETITNVLIPRALNII